jgi:hypothetical protein
MRMDNAIKLSALAMMCCAFAPFANACTLMPLDVYTKDGKSHYETYKEREARERKYNKIAIKKNAAAAKVLLAKGGVDVAGELASLLIPNVRSEDDGMRSNCGPMDGQVFATKNDSIIQDKDFEKAVSGDPLEHKLLEFYQNRPNKGYTSYYFSYPAQQCNLEFRDRFKAFLIAKHSAEELGNIWLFLKPRNRVYQPASLLPMRVFGRDERGPPTSWSYSIGETALHQLQKWDAEPNGEGSKLRETLSEYWATEGPSLNDSWEVCPKTMNSWKPAQDPDNERIITQLTAKAR